MARALQLAERGKYSAHPNPMVGCVLVNNAEVVGEGWHERAGEAHAEIIALRAAGDKGKGATAYISLEPCAHEGKTPPCANALIAAGVSRVVVAMQDPFDEVGGRGLEMLQEAGIETQVGLMQGAAEALNEGFVSRVTQGRPIVRLKIAASIDGATAMESGESQWITVSEKHIHTRGVQPLRVVLESRLRMPPTDAMLALPGDTLVCYTGDHDGSRLEEAGAVVQEFGAHGERVNVFEVLAALAEREVNDVLVEAGPRLAGYLLEKDLIDELVIYQSPHIMGSNTRGMFTTPAWLVLADRRSLNIRDVRRVGNDTRITARVSG
jgi:diaminohydroxyphosphoribosylaminopyrimidine deaminase/5-amino-6-(5-phosphoribosylamino)uracil reductase